MAVSDIGTILIVAAITFAVIMNILEAGKPR